MTSLNLFELAHHPTVWQAYRLILLIAPRQHPHRASIAHGFQSRDATMVHVPLTRAHNRADVFLGALAAALAQEIGEALDPGGPPETVVVDLLNALAAVSGHLFIILDGYGVITAPVVHDAVSLMLDYLPPQVHVVIVTDVEPPLSNLPRLRVRRHMTRIKL